MQEILFPYNPSFNLRHLNCIVDKFMVEKFMAEKFTAENFMVEKFNVENVSTPGFLPARFNSQTFYNKLFNTAF